VTGRDIEEQSLVILEEAGVDYDVVRQLLRKMVDDGDLDTDGEGYMPFTVFTAFTVHGLGVNGVNEVNGVRP
jgi:hypothetical protein